MGRHEGECLSKSARRLPVGSKSSIFFFWTSSRIPVVGGEGMGSNTGTCPFKVSMKLRSRKSYVYLDLELSA